ncbi:3-(cis-5,6-dihydroxycyclohexa-1,3-dien-1-yl)propanoate dehydrogenase [Raineyella sp. W15-4]|uniref:3-(cis-5,6-dihydroxycyclohexa-1, 3-dien-1-yl)propanoate dehydrogenase n=1 Tax=Raineyella sp. W15-4 TaxID=3081651 RepID=UPI002953A1DB|nr:3-(cis-5,6-dihydroxycyclohexa-1,3-dien-1-yl)propanoate dehydrogenase [Raineyella sp. W15-4]WOQ16264.1 3-(cis-5,6-dihydroxycyclohexa-1,3-dien-1-yl)propanoate dehydrogenase [Raineyella sp. W15-4]
MGWLEKNVMIVTGGGSGLGRALVDRFVAEDARVGVLEKSSQRAEELRQAHGDAVHVVEGDVRSYQDNERIVAETVEKYGRLDTFVGNAGIWDFSRKLVDVPADELDTMFDEMFHVNVKGYLHGARAAVKPLAASRGSMIFTVSNAGFYPGGGGPLYTGTKHAVVGLIRQLAYELGPKIRVNGVAPGAIPTDLRGPGSVGMDKTAISAFPLEELVKACTVLQELPTAEDYTGPYVLLASKENSPTATGSIINCDGGMGVRGLAETVGGLDL